MAAVVALIMLLFDFLVVLGVLTTVSLQAGMIFNIVGWLLVLVLGFVPWGTVTWPWHHA